MRIRDEHRIAWILPLAGLLALSALVFVLVREVRQLRQEVAACEAERWTATVGMYVPPFAVGSGPAAVVAGSPDAGAQLVLLLDEHCEFSRASLPAWNRIALGLDPEGRGIVFGLSSRPIDAAAMPELRFPVFAFPGRNYAGMYRASVVPQTLIIDASGRVRYARVGALDAAVAVDSVISAWTRIVGAESRSDEEA